MITELTAYQIAEAFPNEVREYCPGMIKSLELRLIPKQVQLRQLELSKCPKEILGIARQMIEALYPLEIQNLINKYNSCLDLVKRRDTSFQEEELALRIAKARPIESLYNFKISFKSTKRWKAICPFHSEKTASFVIYTDQNTFHCFGCMVKGDAIDFFRQLNKVSFKKAVEALQ